jgi:hypothetical protein
VPPLDTSQQSQPQSTLAPCRQGAVVRVALSDSISLGLEKSILMSLLSEKKRCITLGSRQSQQRIGPSCYANRDINSLMKQIRYMTNEIYLFIYSKLTRCIMYRYKPHKQTLRIHQQQNLASTTTLTWSPQTSRAQSNKPSSAAARNRLRITKSVSHCQWELACQPGTRYHGRLSKHS